ncbi:MAG: HNH nuclease family protein [Gammaproteobacteria bacterium]|nr:HNH nuclease family protein [Gammaproteobacteria bacterium]
MANDKTSSSKLDQMVADSHQHRDERNKGYREKAMGMYPWVCGRCSREFTRANARELTVHHRDHNHSNNPEDGSNWELLCLYCHDNEHSRMLDHQASGDRNLGEKKITGATQNPFADLANLLNKKENE